jgi:sugar-specific transcriptional regulator TrmB
LQLQEHAEKELIEARSEFDELRSETSSILMQLGFSSQAAKAFLAISVEPKIPASVICDKTGIKDSKIYYVLKELEEQRLVTRKEGNPRIFTSHNLKKIREVLLERLEQEHATKVSTVARLVEILGYFNLKSSQVSEDLEIQYVVRGFDKAKDRAINILKTADKEVIGCISSDDLFSAFHEELQLLGSNGVKLKLVLSPCLKSLQEEKQNGDALVSLTRKDLSSEQNILVIDNRKMISFFRTAVNCLSPPLWSATITEDPKMIALSASCFANQDLGIGDRSIPTARVPDV